MIEPMTQRKPGSGFTIGDYSRVIFFLFFIVCMIQNGAALLLFQVDPKLSTAAILFKEILLLFGIFSVFFISFPRISPWFFVVMASALSFSVPSVFSPSFNFRALRTVLNLHLLFGFGILIRTYAEPEYFRRTFLVILFIVGVSGLIEISFLRDADETFFKSLKYSSYYAFREGGALINVGNNVVPASWSTYDYVDYLGRIKRSASLFILDPLLYAHALAVGVVYSIAARRVFLAAFFSVCMLLTASKGGYLVVVLALTLWAQSRIRVVAIRWILSVILVAIIFTAAYTLVGGTSSARHAEGLTGVFSNLIKHPLGTGIGTGGNLGIRELRETVGTAQIDFSEYGAESYFGSLVAQAGIIGFFAYGLFGYLIWHFRPSRSDTWSVVVRYTALATWIAGFGAETPISMVGSGYLFILSALVGSTRNEYLWGRRSSISSVENVPSNVNGTNAEAGM